MGHSAALPGALPASAPKRPGWLRMTGRTLAALIVSTLGVSLVEGLLAWAGFLPEDSVKATAWSLRAEDAWALITDVSMLLIASVALALCLRSYMERNEQEWDVRLWPLATGAALLSSHFPSARSPSVRASRSTSSASRHLPCSWS